MFFLDSIFPDEYMLKSHVLGVFVVFILELFDVAWSWSVDLRISQPNYYP